MTASQANATTIEREIGISAPIETVWEVLTEPEHVAVWFADGVELTAEAGAPGTLTWTRDRKSGADYETPHVERLVVEVVNRPYELAYRWGGDPADASRSALVRFLLREDGVGTSLRVIETDIDRLGYDSARETSYRNEHAAGWVILTDALADYAASRTAAT